MNLVTFFVLAISGILALSLLSFLIDTIKTAPPSWKMVLMMVFLLILTGVTALAGYPLLFS